MDNKKPVHIIDETRFLPISNYKTMNLMQFFFQKNVETLMMPVAFLPYTLEKKQTSTANASQQ